MVLLAVIINLSTIFQFDSAHQDSLPSLHTLADKDIASVSASRQTSTLTVVLNNDSVLLYPHASWDLEDSYPSTPQRISDAIKICYRLKSLNMVRHLSNLVYNKFS